MMRFRRSVLGRVIAAAAVPATADAANWTQFQRAPDLRGHNGGESTLTAHTVGGLQEAWATGANGPIAAQPVVVRGVLYQLTAGGALTAIDLATRAVRWSVDIAPDVGGFAGGSASQVAVRGGRVFVAATRTYLAHPDDEELTTESTLRAYRASTGAFLWRSQPGPWGFSGPTAGPDGRVYVGAWQYEGAYALEAYDAACGTGGATCTPRWRGILTDADGTTPPSAPALADGKVVIQAGGTVSAFDALCGSGGATCSPLWESGFLENDSSGGNPRSVAIAGGLVHAASDTGVKVYGLGGCGAPTCSPLRTLGASDAGGVAMDNRRVWAFDRTGRVEAFSRDCLAATCAPVCATPAFTGPGTSETVAPPVVAGNVLYVTRRSGFASSVVEAYGIRGCTGGTTLGTPAWSVSVPTREMVAGPAVVDGKVLVPFADQTQPSSGRGVIVHALP